jgi:hypothetical protein
MIVAALAATAPLLSACTEDDSSSRNIVVFDPPGTRFDAATTVSFNGPPVGFAAHLTTEERIAAIDKWHERERTQALLELITNLLTLQMRRDLAAKQEQDH